MQRCKENKKEKTTQNKLEPKLILILFFCFKIRIKNDIILDPTEEEEKQSDGHLVLALMPQLNEITQLCQSGEFPFGKLQEAVELASDTCAKIYERMQKVLQSKQKTDE
jgi:exosome complex RNA-binding protein Rrp42 (RNase PH superfamily)